MKRKNILCVALFIVAFSTLSAIKIYAAGAAMPSGTVVIGAKAFAIEYANDPKNEDEIISAILVSGEIYVKGFNAIWIDNNTSSKINANIIPSVTYKSETGVISTYAAGDAGNSTPVDDTFRILSIE